MLKGWNFADALCDAVREKGPLCVGPDPQLRFMPPHLVREAIARHGRTFKAIGWLFAEFNRQIIYAVRDVAACVKPQMAFYEIYGPWGVRAFEATVADARASGLLVIEDAKRGDGGDTADAYAQGHLGKVPFFSDDANNPMALTSIESPVRVDCLTVNGYIGEDCVGRFVNVVRQYGTGIFVVDKTSFKPNSAVEQLVTSPGDEEQGVAPTMVWQELAKMVQQWGEGTEGEKYGLRNVGVVMGATYPDDAPKMRAILPTSILLIPGFGAQGSGAKDAVVGFRDDGSGGIVNSSRGVIYAWQNTKGKYACAPEDFAQAARKQAIDDRDALVAACKEAGKWPY